MTLRPKTGAELRAARYAAAARYEAIAMACVPADHRVEYHRKLTGWHDTERKLIRSPRPVTRQALMIFLHECAHAYLHPNDDTKTSHHVEEMEAELWAFAKMREYGVVMSRRMLAKSKFHIRNAICRDMDRGIKAKQIDSRVSRYAGMRPRDLTPEEEALISEIKRQRRTT